MQTTMQPTQDKSSIGTIIAIVIVLVIIVLAGWFFFGSDRVATNKTQTSPNQAKSLETLEQETTQENYAELEAEINAL